MKLISNEVIYADGNHNSFTSMVPWNGRYWLAFRNGTHHRSPNGQIMVISSEDLDRWSEPQVVVNTSMDDRDPTIYACKGRLFVASLTVDRVWDRPDRPFEGGVYRRSLAFVTWTEDGTHWSKPEVVLPDYRTLWWVINTPGSLLAAGQKRLPVDRGRAVKRSAELWRSRDGMRWEHAGIICDEHQASEVALALLPDERLAAFVRHDDSDWPHNGMEILVSTPPYTSWEHVLDFPFRHNGGGMALIGGTLVTASRAMFEDPETPLVDDSVRARQRGIIIGRLEIEKPQWIPALMIPHPRGVRGRTSGIPASSTWATVSSPCHTTKGTKARRPTFTL
jgi:hypothetical protein